MDYKEEQSQEIEILQSIYPDELEIISETEFNILLKLETNSERVHYLKLNIVYPETYPEVAPGIKVLLGEVEEEDEESEDEDSDEESSPKLTLISEMIEFDSSDLKELENKLIEEAEDQLGMPSVFALASSLKDQAEELFAKKVDIKQKEYDNELLAKEREEQKKFYGTKCTVETFNAWRAKFRKEMGYEFRLQKRLEALHGGKLTGKEIFEKGLANDEETIADQTAKLSVQ